MCTQPRAVPVISLANNFLSLLFIDDRRHSIQVHWLFPDFKGGQVTKASTSQAKCNAGGEGALQSVSRGGCMQGKSPQHASRNKNKDKSHCCLSGATRPCPWERRWPSHPGCPHYTLATATHIQNLIWESTHEPPFAFSFLNVSVQAAAAHANPGTACPGKIAGWKFSNFQVSIQSGSEAGAPGDIIQCINQGAGV